jgi:hypothetical protein
MLTGGYWQDLTSSQLQDVDRFMDPRSSVLPPGRYARARPGGSDWFSATDRDPSG